MADRDLGHEMDMARLALERARFRADILKWLIIAVGAVISFVVIDYGRLRLEQYRATAENERALLQAYLNAGDATNPEVWARKLQVIRTLSRDESLRGWAAQELAYIRQCALKESVYRDTLRVAAELLRPRDPTDPDWLQARKSFERLYWADLPYVRESAPVVEGMVAFRKALDLIERAGTDARPDDGPLNKAMIELARALSKDDPRANEACFGRGAS
jgi:hypothetical protein